VEEQVAGRGLVAGVDCSTQATKAAIVDVETGEVVGLGRAGHAVEGTDGARETDPRVWWTALRDALAETGLAAEVDAISVGGQQHGLVVLDAVGEPLRPAMLWNDTRAAPDAERLTVMLGADRWAERTGLRPVASFTVAKWVWLRRCEPDVANATRAIRLPHDYVTGRLIGAPLDGGLTDRGDASGTGWWAPDDDAYAPDVLELPEVAIDPALLPRVLGPTEVAGDVPRAVADELGLRPGTIVGPGTGDNAASALALGLALGQTAMSLGTSGTVFAISARPSHDASGVVAGFADASGRFLPLAATLNCTQAVDRVADWLGLDRDDVAPAGSVVVLPYLDGERTPNLPRAAGWIGGLRHATTPQQILMAAYEGAVASLVEAMAAISDAVGGIDHDLPLILTGGGARGRTWREVVGRLSGRSVLVPEVVETVAVGAAVQAAATWRDEMPEAVSGRWGTSRGTLLPAPAGTDRERLQRIADTRASLAAVLGAG
jgi:xylulokinase